MQTGIVGVQLLGYSGPISDGGSAWIGLNAAINYTDNDLALTTPVSLECWFWLHPLGAALVGMMAVGDGATTLELGLDATLHPHAFASGGPLTGPNPVTRQSWHHLVLTNTAASQVLYLDGLSVASGVAAPILVWSPGFVGGAGGNPSAPVRFCNAALAELAVYGTALSAARVAAHFAAADATSSRPVFSAAGGLAGAAGGDPTSTGLLQKILQSVRKTY